MPSSTTRGEHERQVDVVSGHAELYDNIREHGRTFQRDHVDNAREALSCARDLAL